MIDSTSTPHRWSYHYNELPLRQQVSEHYARMGIPQPTGAVAFDPHRSQHTGRVDGAPASRFWAKVDRRGDDECWRWLGAKADVVKGDAYGTFWLNGHTHRAHRFSYELLVGPIPDGLQIDHLCRHRYCVNPAHLEAVTRTENMRRIPTNGGGEYQAAKTHCPAGHEYTEANTAIYVDARGGDHRRCRQCTAQQERVRRTTKSELDTERIASSAIIAAWDDDEGVS